MWKQMVCGMLTAAMPLATGAVPASAQDVEEGRIIQVAPDSETEERIQLSDESSLPAPAYWIGLLGGPVSEELRSHLELPAELGILVREVVPESPAEKAGLQQYDILLRAGGDELKNMQDLVMHVVEAGEAKSEIELELIRHGRQEALKVTPESRPERPPVAGNFGNQFPGGFEGQLPNFQFRGFGPNVGHGQPFGNEVPNGVSITMKKEGDQPAEITVKRGDEEWTVVEGDEKSMEQLPEDLRPLVANLNRGPMRFRSGINPGQFRPFAGDLQQRLEAMERQMREFEQQLLDRQGGEN